MTSPQQSSSSLPTYTRSQVSSHSSPSDGWIIINASIYDVSNFLPLHPGGSGVLLPYLGGKQDASEIFFGLHRSIVLKQYSRLVIGTIKDEKPEYHLPTPGELSVVPYAEPTWLVKGWKSPYFNDSHRVLQKEMRLFFDTYVKEEAQAHELTNERPSRSLVERMGEDGININHMRLGPGRHLHGRKLPGGIKPEEFDYFSELVVIQELSLLGSSLLLSHTAYHTELLLTLIHLYVGAPGYMGGLQSGMVIGAPPLLNDAFTTDAVRAEVLPDILAGKKFIALAISEAFVGSDVRGMRTVASKCEDGSGDWIVKGQKKWITGGHVIAF